MRHEQTMISQPQPVLQPKPRNPKPDQHKSWIPFDHEPDRKGDVFRIEEPRLRSGALCNIFSHGLLRSERCHAPDPGEGGGGGGDPPKTFTQDDVNRIVGQRVGEATKKALADAKAEFDKQLAELAPLRQQLEDLQAEKDKVGKTAEELKRIEADKAAKQLERERAEHSTKLTAAEKRAVEAEARHRNLVVSSALGGGLDSAKVLGSARDKAVRLLAAEAEVELDDDGKIVSVTYGGVAHKSAAEAATAFLKDNNFLAAAQGPAGGTGSQRPNAGGNAPDAFKASAEENFMTGLSQPIAKMPGIPGI
jgi:hypothetical protein